MSSKDFCTSGEALAAATAFLGMSLNATGFSVRFGLSRSRAKEKDGMENMAAPNAAPPASFKKLRRDTVCSDDGVDIV